MDDVTFFRKVAGRLGCDAVRAEEVIFAIFQELRDRLTPKEADDVAAQLPSTLKTLWEEGDRSDRTVAPTQSVEFLAHVCARSGLANGAAAERAVKVVFGALQELLGNRRGLHGESWDVFSQLPKSLKRLWLEAAEREVER
ncbi:MAG TPA: DUF2267 domain-containing protein [Candidatus Eisenbacteria bacterium]|nr:DUF2267 domain-containing protein [Candidatus Eisenbacteria bacterium]